jgi:hypothetical protein
VLLILIDAAVLVAMLKSITDDDISFGLACGLALGAAVAVAAGIYGLAQPMGPLMALIVVANGVGIILGVLISALFGTPLKQSFMVAGVFVLVHIGLSIGVSHLLH